MAPKEKNAGRVISEPSRTGKDKEGEMIKITKLKRTCSACPAQWEGETSDKRAIYIRYRWGYLSIRLSEIGGTVNDAVEGKEIYGERIGDGFDGLMDFAELKKLTSEVLDLSGVEEQESDGRERRK